MNGCGKGSVGTVSHRCRLTSLLLLLLALFHPFCKTTLFDIRIHQRKRPPRVLRERVSDRLLGSRIGVVFLDGTGGDKDCGSRRELDYEFETHKNKMPPGLDQTAEAVIAHQRMEIARVTWSKQHVFGPKLNVAHRRRCEKCV